MMVLITVTALTLRASLPRNDYLTAQIAKVTESASSLPVVKPDDGAASSFLRASAPPREKLYHRHFVWGPDIAGQQIASLESGPRASAAEYVGADNAGLAVTAAPACTCIYISACPSISIRRWS
jgi:hypothetical protein